MNNAARAEAGRGLARASGQSMAQSAVGTRGTARRDPSGSVGGIIGGVGSAGSARGVGQIAGISGTGSSRSFAPTRGDSARSSRVAMNSGSGNPNVGHTQPPSSAPAPSGGFRLGGKVIHTDQVMQQAGANSTARPIHFAGARRRPASAFISRPDTATSSAAPVRVAMAGRPGSSGSFSPTVTRTHQTIPTVEEIRVSPPTLVAATPSDNSTDLAPLTNPYELRLSPKLRADFVKRQGGGPETESAVALALEWLKRNQSKDGSWNHRSGHTTAATGAAMLAFLGWGAKHNEPGPYQQTLSSAIDWMLSVEKNGDLRYRGNMYDHGIAAIALMEAYNLTKDERLRAPAERILAFTLKAQNPTSGGWRYKPHREDPSEKGDLSVSGWQMMILKSARLGGMTVPEEAFTKARKFLDGVGVDGKGFQYRPGWKPSSAMIAEGLFCEQMLSAGVKNSKMEQCLSLIQTQLPSQNRVDYYYWYYGSLAMRQAQGQDWHSWNNKLKPILLRKQIQRGNNRGAWEPEGKNAKAAGRVVTTALAALSLEVYYRYLPLYSPELSKADK